MKTRLTALFLLFVGVLYAQDIITINEPDRWTTTDINKYIGKTVKFASPMYVVNNYYNFSNRLTIAPRRIYSPTNQCLPGSSEMAALITSNYTCQITLSNINDYHRIGEKINGLQVKIDAAGQWEYISADSWQGTRDDALLPPSVDGDSVHRLLVCAWNLEYYLTQSFGTGFGPDNQEQHNLQRHKIMQALRLINADIFGLIEIEQGQGALKELTDSLGGNYIFIDDKGYADGSYTKVGYIYDSTKVEPYGDLFNDDNILRNRKKMQIFREKATGETFIFSLNHFKAKSSSSGTGPDADKNDGQGSFNYTRTLEAGSVISMSNQIASIYKEKDILIMGDLNAYAKEDPITTFTDRGFVDLHREFHADSSYSYIYRDQMGYLDHAIANRSMANQVTGMTAWHINSPEIDYFTYNYAVDSTFFRSSDHDPVLVGLRLRPAETTLQPTIDINNAEVLYNGTTPTISNAQGGYIRVYNINGILITDRIIDSEVYPIEGLSSGFYIVDVFANSTKKQFKLIIK